jgi:hypothetical protein
MLHKSTGVLRYERPEGYGWRLVLEIDPGIGLFYRSLIPKWKTANTQAARQHITIVRAAKPPKTKAWGKYEGERVEFWYDPYLHEGSVYWFLDCYSQRLEEIALELGLPLLNQGREPAKGFKKIFHTTVANKKALAQQDRKRQHKRKD